MTMPTLDPGKLSSVIDAMYAMVSGPAGPRDWSLQARVFHPDARQMRTGVDDQGVPWMKIMTLDEYSADTRAFFETHDFFEVEVARRVQLFGNMAHVWSVYEARNAPNDKTPERRGINSIQLFRSAAGEWQITSMIWDNERAGVEVDWSL
ncbi:hypothetical protein [Dokdonella sp.]|uniref:hypothetical protein n=1 Tax=Dokdonella sp. TaxID=2291710 RepID=UPI003527228C